MSIHYYFSWFNHFLLRWISCFAARFLMDYELMDVIKKSNAVILGASAGALNMAAKWLNLETTSDEVETSMIYEGIGFGHFAYESHSLRNYATFVQGYLFPLSEEMDVYAANRRALCV